MRRRKKSRTTSTTYIVRELHSLSGFFWCLERKEDSPTHFAAQLKAKNKTKEVREPSFHPHFRYNIQKVTNCKRTVEEGGGGSGGGYNEMLKVEGDSSAIKSSSSASLGVLCSFLSN